MCYYLSMQCQTIGTFYSTAKERYVLPRQPSGNTSGKIILLPHQNFEQALEDLIGFDKIWILFWMHRNKTWKPKVTPPRGENKRGLFSTRSPHRPNPIGLSCVTLKSIEGLTLFIENHDLLDGTPILDIKPYLIYADAFPQAQQGWLQEIENDTLYPIIWEPKAEIQAQWIEEKCYPNFISELSTVLSKNPHPAPHNRIKKFENHLIWAFKTWRIHFSLDKTTITILSIDSGYDSETLLGKKISKWNDVPNHIEYLAQIW